MYKSNALFILLIMLFFGCRKKEWNSFYGRPDNLAPPIYQVLDGRGNFKDLLAVIDKSGYKETLKTGAGYWTFFAPNDAAFEDYFKSNNMKGVESIDSATARAMIQYMLIYNKFSKSTLNDYQATENNTGWTLNAAFRRRTAYYTGFYKDTSDNGPIEAIASNRNNIASSLTGNYISSDYNNKYITYFIDSYLSSAGLSAFDYNYFYPNSKYTGFNICQAGVVSADIDAENGMIHEIDKVISPLPSIDEYLRKQPQYSSFWKILNRLYTNNTVQFIYNEDATQRYQTLTRNSDKVYVKAYSPLLAYSPNNENFLKIGDNDGQQDCWTMFAPDNEAVDAYVKNTLLKYYPSLDSVPISIITDFLNAQMFPTAVWPSKFQSTVNSFSEPARFDPSSNVIDRKILSNGIFYGTNKVENADIFSTVFSEAYLNPKYTFMTRLFKTAGLNLLIGKSNIPVNIFLIPDSVFAAAGFTYNSSSEEFKYNGSTNGVPDRLDRIIRTCVYFGNYKTETDNLSGSGIVKSGDADGEGEYIKFNNNEIVTSGLEDAGLVAHVDSSKTSSNGKVYYLNNILTYSENGIGYQLNKLAPDETSDFYDFWEYLKNSTSLFNTSTNEIIGLTGYSTLFVPTNAAIMQAVKDGYLPGDQSTGVPKFNSTSPNDMDLVRKFIQYHVLADHTAVPDGNTDPMLYNTDLQNDIGVTYRVRVENYKGSMNLIDDLGRTAHVIINQSNNLSNRCVIHLIDNYLQYNKD
ncbi:fasciclin domain-containing protein [Arachidicoccus sp.]|uniref:fasciclin domain-containing protein n=1 Tax=Arachidicoccus sp. TaxID=1872624 RepID=UPI003D25770F